MALDDAAILALLADPDKRIVGDLRWTEVDDQPGSRELLAPVRCAASDLLLVRGQRCAAAGSLRFALLLRGVGRIAALDLGHAHQDPDGRRCGELHLHRWTPGRRDHHAEALALSELHPGAPASDPIAGAWHLFCRLLHITHDGALTDPPPAQETLL